MNEKLTSYMRLIVFLLVLVVLDLGVIHAYLVRHAGPQAVVIQEDPALAAFRYDVARGIGILMQSGCFNSSDRCCKYTDEMIMHTEEGLTLEAYHQYLADGISHLWETRCIEHIEGCGTFAFGLLRSYDEGAR